MRHTARLAVALLFVAATAARAQSASGGTISGVVTDPAGQPLSGAAVNVLPSGRHVVSDSSGRFSVSGIPAGFYHVRARHIGYLAVDISTDLSKNGHVSLDLRLDARPTMLDSVVVQANGTCPELSYVGFNCRKRSGKGVFLTDDDIADKGAIELGDIFDGIDGFRIEQRRTEWGLKPIPVSVRGSRCLNALVNGRPLGPTNPLPRWANELVAIEIYAAPGDAPQEYSRYVWDGRIRQSRAALGGDSPTSRCALVVYWTRIG